MDLIGLIARGLGVGFAIAAAIGPIGLLCIRRTLTEGVPVGLASGLGAATADALYAAVAAFGLTVISDLLVAERRALGVVGGVALLVLAVHSFRDPAAATVDQRQPRGLRRAYATTLGLTITNPATILSFAAAFVGLGLAGHGGPGAAALVLGVLSGSAAWWVVLTTGVGLLRGRVTATGLGRLAKGSNGLIGALGVLAIGLSLGA